MGNGLLKPDKEVGLGEKPEAAAVNSPSAALENIHKERVTVLGETRAGIKDIKKAIIAENSHIETDQEKKLKEESSALASERKNWSDPKNSGESFFKTLALSKVHSGIQKKIPELEAAGIGSPQNQQIIEDLFKDYIRNNDLVEATKLSPVLLEALKNLRNIAEDKDCHFKDQKEVLIAFSEFYKDTCGQNPFLENGILIPESLKNVLMTQNLSELIGKFRDYTIQKNAKTVSTLTTAPKEPQEKAPTKPAENSPTIISAPIVLPKASSTAETLPEAKKDEIPAKTETNPKVESAKEAPVETPSTSETQPEKPPTPATSTEPQKPATEEKPAEAEGFMGMIEKFSKGDFKEIFNELIKTVVDFLKGISPELGAGAALFFKSFTGEKEDPKNIEALKKWQEEPRKAVEAFMKAWENKKIDPTILTTLLKDKQATDKVLTKMGKKDPETFLNEIILNNPTNKTIFENNKNLNATEISDLISGKKIIPAANPVKTDAPPTTALETTAEADKKSWENVNNTLATIEKSENSNYLHQMLKDWLKENDNATYLKEVDNKTAGLNELVKIITDSQLRHDKSLNEKYEGKKITPEQLVNIVFGKILDFGLKNHLEDKQKIEDIKKMIFPAAVS